MTQAQKRLVDLIRQYGECAEFWPVVNDWVKDSGRAKALALRNINRTVDALTRANVIRVNDEGVFELVA